MGDQSPDSGWLHSGYGQKYSGRSGYCRHSYSLNSKLQFRYNCRLFALRDGAYQSIGKTYTRENANGFNRGYTAAIEISLIVRQEIPFSSPTE